MTHLFFLFALTCAIPQSNRRLPFYLFSIFSLFLFLAFRYDYGNDYMNYMQVHFNLNNGLSAYGEDDLLFSQLNTLIPNFFIYIVIISIIYISCVFLLIFTNLEKRYFWLGLLILLINPYLFLVHLSSIRQTLAICAFILSIKFLINKKRFLCILFIFIAAGFHVSALILLPVPFFLNVKKLRWTHYCLILFSVFTLLATPLLEKLLEWIYILLPQFEIYNRYVEQEITFSLRSALLTTLFILFVILYFNSLRGPEIIYGKLTLLAFFISVISYLNVSMLSRIGMYFEIFSVVTLPSILIRNRSSVICKIFFSLLLIIYFLRYFSFFNSDTWQSSYIQYKSVLSLLF